MAPAKAHPYMVSFGAPRADRAGPRQRPLSASGRWPATGADQPAAGQPGAAWRRRSIAELAQQHRPHGGDRGLGRPRRDHRAHRRIAGAGARQHAARHGVLADQHRVGPAVRRVPRRRRWRGRCSRRSASALEGAAGAARRGHAGRRSRCRAGRRSRRNWREVRAHGLSAARKARSCRASTRCRRRSSITPARWCWRSPRSGPAAVFDTGWEGATALALRASADAVSRRLGAPGRSGPAN